MRLTVLGSAASHAGPGQACSGHLVQSGETSVLFDCGNGVIANLYKVADPYSLDAVFVTHNHPDHYADVYSLQAMLRYAPQGTAARLRLFASEELFCRMQAILSERGAEQFRQAFLFEALRPGVPMQIGALSVTAHEVDHTDPTYALVANDGTSTLCYTADTAPGSRVLAAATGADLLLAEATLPQQYAGVAPHLTAAQAGELARGSGARKLVLTHVWPTNDRRVMAQEAGAVFGGPVIVATELDTFDITTKGLDQ